MDLRQLNELSYLEIVNYVISSYRREFGDRKYFKVINKIDNSGKISRLIDESIERQVEPGSMDFLHRINEIPYFIFSSGQTQAVAALHSMERWNTEVNLRFGLLSEEGLRQRAINILNESRFTFI